jgi:GrpB-like predicted nucleotidyltransferase (UPF0157 family)
LFLKPTLKNSTEGVFQEPVRDYLIKHPDTAREYVMLKTMLAENFRFDRDAYTDAKTEFIMMITNLAKKER